MIKVVIRLICTGAFVLCQQGWCGQLLMISENANYFVSYLGKKSFEDGTEYPVIFTKRCASVPPPTSPKDCVAAPLIVPNGERENVSYIPVQYFLNNLARMLHVEVRPGSDPAVRDLDSLEVELQRQRTYLKHLRHLKC